MASGNFQPTAGAYERLDDLKPEIAEILSRLEELIHTELSVFNEAVRSQDLPAVMVKPSSRPSTTEEGGN